MRVLELPTAPLALTIRRSSPSPPVIIFSPLPPLITLFPASPASSSLPSPPEMPSSPAPPAIVSSPPKPLKTSLRFPPVIMSGFSLPSNLFSCSAIPLISKPPLGKGSLAIGLVGSTMVDIKQLYYKCFIIQKDDITDTNVAARFQSYW